MLYEFFTLLKWFQIRHTETLWIQNGFFKFRQTLHHNRPPKLLSVTSFGQKAKTYGTPSVYNAIFYAQPDELINEAPNVIY